MIKELCKKCNDGDDEFVGLRFEKNKPCVYFLRGYALSSNDEDARCDILHLFAALQRFSNYREGIKSNNISGDNTVSFPILSYQFIIKDFLDNGYYVEKEVFYTENNRGKINWKRTIQKETPQVDNNNIIYLDFIVKKNRIKDNNLITKIHQYCVYESFVKLGWLYLSSDALPQKPTIRFNRRLFLSVIREELANTFNDKKRMLFNSMINIIENCSEDVESVNNFYYGVHRFEYVWENIIDYVFGESNKDKYFPHATWHLIGKSGKIESSALEPDTIIKLGDKIFIIDAKYYKYGITNNPMHLPGSSSIQKQITYAEYVENNFGVDKDSIYNAFLLPFEKGASDDNFKFVSVATADWKEYSNTTPNYNFVLGILVDTKYLIENYTRQSKKDIFELSDLIIKSVENYRIGSN